MVTRRLLRQECKRVKLSEAAQSYVSQRRQLAERAAESKKKDFVRGEHIDPVGKRGVFHEELLDDAQLREGHGGR